MMKVKEESEKAGLKLNIQKTKIMACGPITSWQIEGEKKKRWQILFSWVPKSLWMVIAAMKWKDTPPLKEKAMTNLGNILKSRDITLPTKISVVKAIVVPIFMSGCEHWTIKKLSAKELMLLNCDAGEDSLESFGLQRDPTNQSERKSVPNIH